MTTPFQQTDSDLHTLALIHGPYGTGKTTLGHTMPGPRMVFEVEHGSQFVRVKKAEWVVGQKPPKAALDPDVSVLCKVDSWRSYRWFMDQALHEPRLPFRSIVFDTWSQIQSVLSQTIRGRLSMDELDKLPARNYEHWDKMKTAMEQDMEDLNLLRVRKKGPKNVLILSATELRVEPHQPLIKGGAQATLPALLDLLGYLEVERLHEDQWISLLKATKSSKSGWIFTG